MENFSQRRRPFSPKQGFIWFKTVLLLSIFFLKASPTTSLDSSVSSTGSSNSAHSHGMGHQSPPTIKPIRRPGPPPGLGDVSVMITFFHLWVLLSFEHNTRLIYTGILLILGLMAITVGCEFCDRVSIPSVCQITDADLGQVG